MALTSGTRLGAYEIVALIGSGGMGEVYRATDTRLARTVAIKVLPDHHIASDPDLKPRFEREAKTLAALSHPHICPVFDVGNQDGVDFLVMEYLEGETLEQRLKKGALPLDQALQVGIQMADALAVAHRAAIVHRDLKPGNIMLASSKAKLLDFGLATTAAPAVAGSLSKLPTTPPHLTQQGTILGTFQYMAPEQLEGRDVDARTDIFAFGAVVYEMVTGRKAFEGKSQASLIAAILDRDPPPMSVAQPLAPAALDRIVKKCLAKEPERRWQSAGDLADELRWITDTNSYALSPQVTTKGRGVGRWWPAIGLGAFLIGGVVAGFSGWTLNPAPPPLRVSRTVIALPPGDRLAGLERSPVALSADGSQLAYIATRGGTQQIYLRALESAEAKPVLGTEGAIDPFFSPDGHWLGFFGNGKLTKVSVSGGAPIVLSEVAASPRGASWSGQGTIVFNPLVSGSLQQVPDGGGSLQVLTHPETGDTGHRWPHLLPNGRALLFAGGTTSNPRIAVYSLTSGEQRQLIQRATIPRYLPSGHLVYIQGTNLMAVPFDAQRLEVAGAAVPVVENIRQSPSVGAAHYSTSATGSLVYVPGGTQPDQRKLVWVSRTGVAQPLTAQLTAGANPAPRLAPDGGRLAVGGGSGGGTQSWLYDIGRERLTPFTSGPSTSNFLTWTPDGKRIAFNSNRQGPVNLFWQMADGSGGLEQLASSANPQYPLSFSPDGQRLAFAEVSPTTSYDIWILHLTDRKAQPFLQTPLMEASPRFSPDGRWLAYVSNESGRVDVWVQAYPGPGGKSLISTEGGNEPAWNPNGRELFYRNGDKMMAVDVTTGSTFSAGKPRLLFERHYLLASGVIPAYDVSHDGQRFLMVEDGEPETPITQINVVLNWAEELKRLVPRK